MHFFVVFNKGQSEIKSLKREREQLRREIWTLRDEYDKLENLLRIKGIDPDEFLNINQDNKNEELDDENENLSDCSECSCESCCDDDCCNEKSEQMTLEKSIQNVNDRGETSSSLSSSPTTHTEEHKRLGKDRMNVKKKKLFYMN